MDEKVNLQRLRPRRGYGLAFFLGFLRRPDLVGSVIPSSRFLEQRIVDVADVKKARLVVELGPGTGGTTRAILEALPQDARLLAIEINPAFVSILGSNDDPRLIVHNGSAEDIEEALAMHGLSNPDVVISGIPFSTMPLTVGRRILGSVWSSLTHEGQFVAYQFRGRVADLGRELFGKPEIELELLNVPPMRVFCWRKISVAEQKESGTG